MAYWQCHCWTIAITSFFRARHEIFLLTKKFLQNMNSSTISQLFFNSLKSMWPKGLKHDALVFIIDIDNKRRHLGKLSITSEVASSV